MLVRLQDGPKHLASFQARLLEQLIGQVERERERDLHNLVKIHPVLSSLETIYSADGEQALDASEHGLSIVAVQQIECDVEELGPFRREVVGQDLLEGGNELHADRRR